ncbi:hypothetical protein VE00_09764 [Pseudogymnoascus sp. WSF 3629]|nr:hypothetical protein VE00_09764 [Pseudogymnoascus sp. WSF 3629]
MPGTIIVTGAAGGLGLAVAETVLNRNESYNCLFTVRDKDAARAKPLHDLIASSSNNNEASTPEIDLSRPDSIRAFATLILNAAFFMEKGSLQFTQDDKDVKGFEMHFAVNYLANFLLTLLLLESMDKEHGRIPDKLKWDPEELAHPKGQVSGGDEAADATRRYGTSKLSLVMFMHALQKRLNATSGLEKICVLGVDPGGMIHDNIMRRASALQRHLLEPAFRPFIKVTNLLYPNEWIRTVQKSSNDIVRAALQTDDPILGQYPKDAYLNGNETAESAAESKDEGKQKVLWEASLRYTRLDETETALKRATVVA